MSTKVHHQRRHRRFNWVWVFKLITGLGQAAYYAVRFWIWLMDQG